MKDRPFNVVKEAMRSGSGNASPSFVSNLLGVQESGEDTSIDDELIKSISGIIYVGGIDTVDIVVQFFFIAMILHPNVQKAAQKELERVIGSNTFPTFKDRPNLPYINALCKEVLRWHPVTPVGIPHLLKHDDVIGGYFIPKGTLVMGSTWSLLHSEAVYGSDVNVFNPERFLKEGVKDPDFAFGYGRRICPGRDMADSMLFILFASVLHTFDIKPHGTTLPNLDELIPGTFS
ncbi:hypothetical protein Clacol_000286 [Clathrus columnatus]|uniref:Cytochrome P450 n=1 Tax=Clathrus columnatus TaxID=1419009 RepID=A0AAV4ZY51_9AGAM|nr:hypothetical protein Clacol_000286 [Clathrus columnatus]